ncbi:MAG: hypothetical protein CMI36_12745 [Owenweeksia sp.]|nr:hypothetical protein [Owenweeksia sp.]MBF99427.1 hypothetical protein [Owenweeksia sp.]MBF99854.1 hypothetical protein [Owenweeksia sp.]HBF20857.1 hypothetical protein [Cryomorphaceae bacterium]|tara:strand:+ start:1022 stop:2233 length:1212 start_codon:yes stop_codon:yes gene_type:complete
MIAMRSTLSLILLFALTTACGIFNSLDYYKVREKSDIVTKDFYKEMSFLKNRPVILIPVEIGGRTYNFIFDTGAAVSVISKELAGELGLEEEADVMIHDSKGHNQELIVSLIDTIDIAGVQFIDIAAVVVDWSENSVISCVSPAGIIGNNLIRHANWRVDYKNHQLVVSDSSLHIDGMHYVEMQSPEGRPFISLKADSLEIAHCLLDLGSGGSLDLSREMAEDWNWKKYPYTRDIDGSSEGLFGSKLDTTINVKIDSLSIGGYTLYETVVDIEKKSGSKIGTKVLEQSILNLDYSNSRVGFLPYDSIPTYGHLKEGGFAVLMDSSGFYISSITEDAALWQRGVRYGDRVKSLNGKQPADFGGFCEFVEWLLDKENRPQEFTLVMENDPQNEIIVGKEYLWSNE